MSRGARRGRVPSAEELRLWAAAMKDATPLPGRALPDLPPEAPDEPEAARAAPDVARPVPPKPKPRVENPRPEVSVGDKGEHATRLDGLDGSTAEKLRRGRMAIEARLDLHGMTQDEAWRALESFLARAEASGRRSLLVITGTGLRSRLREWDDDRPFRMDERRPGVLRDALPRWLAAPHNRPRILAWSPAQQKDGGVGAFYVLLRRKRG